MLLTVLFWFFVVLSSIGLICHLALPVGTKRSDYSIGSKVGGITGSVLICIFYYLIYQSGIV